MRREGSMENEKKRGKYGKWEEREVWKMRRREGSMENEKRGKYGK